MPLFDVAVIGAGPAGGSAARHSVERGLKTVLLEEHKTVGEPVHCGECLSEIAMRRMDWKLPEKVVSENVKGVRVIFPNSESSTVTEAGYVLEKQLFEQWIANEAQKEGAELLLDHKLLDLKRENSVWKLQTNHGELQSKIVIDASGPATVASRKLKLNPPIKSDLPFDTVTGIQYELLDIPRDGYLDFFLWPRLAEFGYLWMIPKKDGRANVGLVTTQTSKAKVFLDTFVKEMDWEQKTKVKTFGGSIPHSGPVPNTYSEGLFLVGDAAGFTSPLFEGGTQLGLRSGQFAATVAARSIRENNFSKNNLAEYEKLWKKEFPSYAALLKGKKALYGFSEEELNQMAGILPKEMGNLKPTDKAKVGIKLLATHRHLLQKGAMDALSAFAYSRAEFYGW